MILFFSAGLAQGIPARLNPIQPPHVKKQTESRPKQTKK